MPVSTIHPYLDHPGGIIAFAHRGGAVEFPENTMEAFQGAVDLGYRYIETDVHATQDGALMAFHDDKLDRVTDKAGPLNALSAHAVSQAKIGGTHAIPRLEDLLTSFPDIRINIDPKADTSVVPLMKVLEQYNAFDRVCIGSFSGKRLQHMRDAYGDKLCTSMGPFDVARLRFGSWGVPTGRHQARCAQVPIYQGGIKIVDKRFCDHAHANGLQVHVWTIDDETEMDYLLRAGVDGIMTDRPAVLKKVLQQAGQWGA